MAENYSVLMSVYYKEKPEYLREAMQSMFDQTVPTNDFVLVCDGPLTKELDSVIEEKLKEHLELHVVRLKENGGLGNALNYGMKFCKNELVARMDSDDISYPNRCEKQLEIFQKMKKVSVCSGIIEEFIENKECVENMRILPEKNWEIILYAKRRNPFNHPCVMYKKSDVLAAGGYQDFFLLEDYYLWVRMLLNDCQGYNLQEPLLWMRTGSELYKRRGGWKYAKAQNRLFKIMKEKGLIKQGEYYSSISVRIIGALMSNRMRQFLYKKVLRKIRNSKNKY